jgi:FAD:protein FMN transferase
MTHEPKTPHRGPAMTRRRAMAIMGVATGLPWIGVTDRSDAALLLYQWDGTSLGSPSRLLLYHHDRATASRIVSECAAEIERLERIFALYRTDSEIARLNRDGHIEFPSVDLLTVLSQCQVLSSLSRGAFDVSVQPLWTLYAHIFSGGPHREQKGRRRTQSSSLARSSTGKPSSLARAAFR